MIVTFMAKIIFKKQVMYFAKIVSSLVCKFLWVAVTKVNHKVISIVMPTNMYSLYPLQTFDTLQALLHSKK